MNAEEAGGRSTPRQPTAAALRRDAELHRRVLAAAGACVERLGLDGATVDDIAAESGISRATLYRKFGNREAILDALVGQHAGPFANEAIRILMGPGNMARRIEQALMRGLLDLPEQRWLDDALGQGAASSGAALFHATYRPRVRAVLHCILQSDQVRPGLELEAVLDWFMRELVLLLAARPWNEHQLRNRIAMFIVPVLVPDLYV